MSITPISAVRVSRRWFRLLLRLYPVDFREEMGSALLEAYEARAQEVAGRHSFKLAGVWATALWDSLRNGIGERLSPAVCWRRAGNWGRDMERVTRRLRQRPLALASALATLTIGLGTFGVVYTAVEKILLEPLPYENPADLYMIWRPVDDGGKFVISGPEAAELRQQHGVIENTAILRWSPFTLPADERNDALPLVGMAVTPEFFDVLRVQPAIGRRFSAQETGSGAGYLVVLTDTLWKKLGGARDIVGSTLRISGRVFTVIGIMPPGFRFGASESTTADAFFPLYDDLPVQPPLIGDWMALARARHGAPAWRVQEEVDRISRLVDERVNEGKKRGLTAIGLQADMVEQIRPALTALSFAGFFLMLALAANLASLLLARAAEREREFAVSRALGAQSTAVVRATIIEGGLLGLAGGITGSLAAIWGTRLLVNLGPADLPRRDIIAPDAGTTAVIVTVGFLLGLAAAAAPAVWASRVSLPSLLAAAFVRGGGSTGRLRRGLIVAQLAFSFVLLSAGGLVLRSFDRLLSTDPGFQSGGLLTFRVGLGNWIFPNDAEVYAFEDRVSEEMAALPGVRGVSSTTTLPLSGGGSVSWFYLPGRTADGVAGYRIFVRSGYLETMGIRIVAGRFFEKARYEGIHEAVIDQQSAQHFFPDGNAIGNTIMVDDRELRIVGIAEQAHLESLHKNDGRPQIFLRAEDHGERPTLFVLRADGDLHALTPHLRTILRRIDRRVPVQNLRIMDDIVAERRSRERISTILIAGFAAGALCLVSMGLFGVISGSVARRRGELAIRLAMGATRGRVIWLVVEEGARLLGLGLLLGVPGVYLAGSALQGLLIDVSPFDASTLTAAAAGLFTVSLLISYLAARRVASIEPEQLFREGT